MAKKEPAELIARGRREQKKNGIPAMGSYCTSGAILERQNQNTRQQNTRQQPQKRTPGGPRVSARGREASGEKRGSDTMQQGHDSPVALDRPYKQARTTS